MNIFQKAAVTFVLKTIFGIKKVRVFLQGKKSYLIGVGIIIDAILKWLQPNGSDTTTLVTQILIGAGFFAIRAAITNNKKKE